MTKVKSPEIIEQWLSLAFVKKMLNLQSSFPESFKLSLYLQQNYKMNRIIGHHGHHHLSSGRP